LKKKSLLPYGEKKKKNKKVLVTDGTTLRAEPQGWASQPSRPAITS